MATQQNITIDTNRLLTEDEYLNKVGIPITSYYSSDEVLNVKESYLRYAEDNNIKNNKDAIALWGAYKDPSRIGKDRKWVEDNPVTAAFLSNQLELAEVSYEVYKNAYLSSNKQDAQRNALKAAENFLYQENDHLANYAFRTSSEDKAKFALSLSSLSAVMGINSNAGEVGQLGYIPYTPEYGIGALVPNIDQGLDIGNQGGIAAINALQHSLLGKLGMYFGGKYKSAAIMESLKQGGDNAVISDGVRATTTIAGYGLSMLETAATAYATKNTKSILVYQMVNGGMSDMLDTIGLSRKYLIGNSEQKAHYSGFIGSRIMEGATYGVSMGLSGRLIEPVVDKFLPPSLIASGWGSILLRNSLALGADTAFDTTFDFIMYSIVRGLDKNEGKYITSNDYYMFRPSADNIWNVFSQRLMLRMGRSIGFNLSTIAKGNKTGWGSDAWFKENFKGQLVAENSIKANAAKALFRTIDIASPNHFKEMDQYLQDEGGLINLIKNNPDTFTKVIYSRMYMDFEASSNEFYKWTLRKKDRRKTFINLFKDKDYNLEYLDLLTNKKVELNLIDENGNVDKAKAKEIGKFYVNKIHEINNIKDLSNAEKEVLVNELRDKIYDLVIFSKEVSKETSNGTITSKIGRTLNNASINEEQQRAIYTSIIQGFDANANYQSLTRDNDALKLFSKARNSLSSSVARNSEQDINIARNAIEKYETNIGNNKTNSNNKKVIFEEEILTKLADSTNSPIVYLGKFGQIVSEDEFRNIQGNAIRQHSEISEFIKEFEKAKREEMPDYDKLTTEEKASMLITGNRWSMVDQIAYDLITSIKDKTNTDPVSTKELVDAVFKEKGLLEQYRSEIRRVIKEYKDSQRTKDKRGISKELTASKVQSLLIKYHNIMTLFGYKAGRSIGTHIKAFSALIDNPEYKEFLSGKALSESIIAKLYEAELKNVSEEKFGERLGEIQLVVAIQRGLNINRMLGLVNTGSSINEEYANELVKYNTDTEEKELTDNIIISQKGFPKLPDGNEITVEINNEKVTISDTDNIQTIFRTSTDKYNEKLLAFALYKLAKIDKEEGTNVLKELIAQESLKEILSVTTDNNGNVTSITIKGDVNSIPSSSLRNIYTYASEAKTGITTYRNFDGDNTTIDMRGGETLYTIGKTTYNFKDLLDKFMSQDGNVTGAMSIIGDITIRTNRANAHTLIKKVLANTRPDIWSKMNDETRDRFASSVQNSAEYWNNQVEAGVVQRVASGKYSFDVEISVLALSRVNRNNSFPVWAISKPQFKDLKDEQANKAKWERFLDEHNLIKVAEAGAGLKEIYVKLPYGTKKHQLGYIAKALYDMKQTGGLSLKDSDASFEKYVEVNHPDLHKKIAEGKEFSPKELLTAYGLFIKSRYADNIDVPSLKRDVKIDGNANLTGVTDEVVGKLDSIKEKVDELLNLFSNKTDDNDEGKVGINKAIISDIQNLMKITTFGDIQRRLLKGLVEKFNIDSKIVDNLLSDVDQDVKNYYEDFIKNIQDLEKELRSLDATFNKEAFDSQYAKYKDISDLLIATKNNYITATNSAKDIITVLMAKQNKKIFGIDTSENDFSSEVNKMSDEKAMSLLCRTIISGPASAHYGIDYAKRYGILDSSNSIFVVDHENNTLVKGLEDLIKDGNKYRIIIQPSLFDAEDKSFAAGIHFLPESIIRVIMQYTTTADSSQKLAVNVGGLLIKGLFISNKNATYLGGIKPDTDIVLNADDIKNMHPEMLKLFKEENNRLTLELDLSDKDGRKLFRSFFSGFTLQTDLTSTPRDRGVGVPLSTVAPSNNRMINAFIDNEMASVIDDKVKQYIYEDLLGQTVDKYSNSLSRKIRAGIKAPGNVVQALPKFGPLDEANDLVFHSVSKLSIPEITEKYKKILKEKKDTLERIKNRIPVAENVFYKAKDYLKKIINSNRPYTDAEYKKASKDVTNKLKIAEALKEKYKELQEDYKKTEALSAEAIKRAAKKEDITVIINKREVSLRDIDRRMMRDTHSLILSVHSLVSYYAQIKNNIQKSGKYSKDQIDEFNKAYEALVKMESGDPTISTNEWKQHANTLMEPLSDNTLGVFHKVKLDGEDAYVGFLNRNPNAINFQGGPIIISGVRPPTRHRGIEISHPLMTYEFEGDFDGDLLMSNKATKKMLEAISVDDEGNKIALDKGIYRTWYQSAEASHLVRGPVLAGSSGGSARMKEEERAFVGSIYAAAEKGLALISFDDGKVTSKEIESTKVYQTILDNIDKQQPADNKAKLTARHLIRVSANNGRSYDPHKFVVYSPRGKNVWGNVHGNVHISYASDFAGEFRAFASEMGLETTQRRIYLTRYDKNSGGYEIIGIFSNLRVGKKGLDDFVTEFNEQYKSGISNNITGLEEVMTRVAELKQFDMLPNTLKGKSFMSVVGIAHLAVDLGVNAANAKGDTRTTTFIIDKFGGLQNLSKALTEFTNKAYIATSFDLSVGENDDIKSSVFSVNAGQVDDTRIIAAIEKELLNTNHKIIAEIAKNKMENGYGRTGISLNDINDAFIFSGKNKKTPEDFERAALLYDKLNRLDWDNIKHRANGRVYYAYKILQEMANVITKDSELSGNVRALLNEDYGSQELTTILDHISNKKTPFPTSIKIGEDKIPVEIGAYQINRILRLFSDVYAVGDPSFGLRTYNERVNKSPVIIANIPIDKKLGKATPEQYAKNIMLSSNRMQKYYITERDVNVLFDKLKISFSNISLPATSLLTSKEYAGLLWKHQKGFLTKEDIKTASKTLGIQYAYTLTSGGKPISVEKLFSKFENYVNNSKTPVEDIKKAKAILTGLYETMSPDTKEIMAFRNDGITGTIANILASDQSIRDGNDSITAGTLLKASKLLSEDHQELIKINGNPRAIRDEYSIKNISVEC